MRVFPIAVLLALTGGAAAQRDARYLINDHLLIKRSAARWPAAFEFTIYADPAKDVQRMKYAADRGYVGITAYTRGKAHSPQQPVPYEFDGRDADSVIEWIAKQSWSNGEVGMFGRSYDGFTQWALQRPADAKQYLSARQLCVDLLRYR